MPRIVTRTLPFAATVSALATLPFAASPAAAKPAVEVAFAPGSPITDKNQLPSLSRARTDQKLTLIFRVSLNVSVTGYAIGTKVVQELTPPKKLDQAQR